MKKVDPTIRKETRFILAVTLILSALMEAVFLVIGKWSVQVMLGNLVGAAASVGNFFLMGLTVQSALEKEEKEAKKLMRVSQMLRNLLLLSAAVVFYCVTKESISLLALVITYLFPRIGVFFRPMMKEGKEERSE